MSRVVYEENNFRLVEYEPKFTNLFGEDFEKHGFFTKIRFFIEKFFYGGYTVYYLKEEGVTVASCIVSYGRNVRYFFAGDKDIIVGPYFVDEKHRGRGLAKKIIRMVLENTAVYYENAWDYICEENIASIKATEALDFSFVMRIGISELTHRMSKDDKGKYLVYKYQNICLKN